MRWLLLSLFVLSFSSCGKENTLVVAEPWSVALPFEQPAEDGDVSVHLKTSISKLNEATYSAELTASPKLTAPIQITLGQRTPESLNPGESKTTQLSAQEFNSILNSKVQINSSQNNQSIALETPKSPFDQELFEQQTSLCFQTLSSRSQYNWANSSNGYVTISTSDYSYKANEMDIGFWSPGYDFLQKIFPEIKPTSETLPTLEKLIHLSVTRQMKSSTPISLHISVSSIQELSVYVSRCP